MQQATRRKNGGTRRGNTNSNIFIRNQCANNGPHKQAGNSG